jgi:ferrous iron transport protein A
MSLEDATSLSNLAPGERGTVTSLTGGRHFVSRLAALGLTPGGEVSMTQNFGRGPIIVRIRGTRLALGRGEAQKVQVRKRMERG